MNCFHFSNGEKSTSGSRKSRSTRSNSTRSSDRDRRRWESDSNSSLDMFAFSGRSSRFPSLSQRPNNVKVFTFKELKNATNNFSHALMIGEGGFGCVYRGTIRSPKDPSTSFDVAIKRLNRGGNQVNHFLFFLCYCRKMLPNSNKCSNICLSLLHLSEWMNLASFIVVVMHR